MIYLIIFFVAISMSMTGKGGGIFYVPMLTLLGLELDDAISSSQVIIAISATASFLVFRKNKVIDWKLILITEPFTVLFAFTGAYLSSSIDHVYIKAIFISALIIPIILMFKKPKVNLSERFVIKRKIGDYTYNLNYRTAIIISSVAGFISGVSGIAGGSIKVPLFIGLCGIQPIVAIGSSSFMIIITSLSSVSGQLAHSNLDIVTSLPYAAAAMLGNVIGSKFSLKIKSKNLKYLIIITSLVSLVMMIIA